MPDDLPWISSADADPVAGTHADSAQTATEQRLLTVIEHVPAGLVAADVSTQRFIFVNAWFCQMLGYSRAELLGLSPTDIHPPEVLQRVESDFQQMKSGQSLASLAVPVRRKDGRVFMANIERVPIDLDQRASVLAIFSDVTLRHQAEQALKQSESNLRTLINTIPDLIWLKDGQGVYLACNPAFERFFGAPEAEIMGKTDHDFVDAKLADSFRANDLAAMATDHALVNEEWVTLAATGQRVLLQTSKVAVKGDDGQVFGVLGISHDITELRAATAALEAERLQLQNALDAVQAGTWQWQLADQTICYNKRAAAILGRLITGAQQDSYANYLSWIHPDDQAALALAMRQHLDGVLPHYEGEMRMRHDDGHWVWCRSIGRVMQRAADGQPLLVAGITMDITEHRVHREQLAHASRHDPLTGLPNRKLFIEVLAGLMVETHAPQRLVVVYLDIDGLSAINERLGRDRGNQMILDIGQRLARAMDPQHYLGHIGGDEFAVALSGLDAAAPFDTPVQQLLAHVAQVHEQVTASAGVAVFTAGDKVDAEQLLRQASQAMYQAKLAGKNRFAVFDPVTEESARARYTRIDEIALALDRREFVLHFQPKVHLTGGEVVGFEALIRWQHPQQGLLAPAAFIPLLEQHPLLIALGDWVIEATLNQLGRWNSLGLRTRVSVNTDAQQLHDPDFVARLQRQLAAQPDVQPQQLEIEILETGALEDMAHVAEVVARLQAQGIECALDDFGTGYSSLTFLKRLAAHTIKIDQSFVRGGQDDPENATIVHSIVALARNFRRQVLAEGIETVAQGLTLIDAGCEFGQGYLIARPMPAAEVPHWLAGWRLPDAWSQRAQRADSS